MFYKDSFNILQRKNQFNSTLEAILFHHASLFTLVSLCPSSTVNSCLLSCTVGAQIIRIYRIGGGAAWDLWLETKIGVILGFEKEYEIWHFGKFCLYWGLITIVWTEIWLLRASNINVRLRKLILFVFFSCHLTISYVAIHLHLRFFFQCVKGILGMCCS